MTEMDGIRYIVDRMMMTKLSSFYLFITESSFSFHHHHRHFSPNLPTAGYRPFLSLATLFDSAILRFFLHVVDSFYYNLKIHHSSRHVINHSSSLTISLTHNFSQSIHCFLGLYQLSQSYSIHFPQDIFHIPPHHNSNITFISSCLMS